MSKKDIWQIVLVTGMSGAGRTTVLNALEDIGFEVFDNLPLSLFNFLVEKTKNSIDDTQLSFLQYLAKTEKTQNKKQVKPLAIGVDIRTRDFNKNTLKELRKNIKKEKNIDFKILFVDCDDDVLINRFKETRRIHILAKDRKLSDGILEERKILEPIKELSDLLIDTTNNKVNDTKIISENLFKETKKREISIFVSSFSYRKGVPKDADLVFDVRFLKNPHYIPELREKTGLDKDVGEYIKKDKDYDSFLNNLKKLLEPLLPRYKQEGKNYLTIAFGCTGGQHRSVFLAEEISSWLKEKKALWGINHKELKSKGIIE